MIRLPDSHAAERRGQPTLEEAVSFLLKHREPVFLAYRRECLAHWRRLFGDEFAARVEAGVRARW